MTISLSAVVIAVPPHAKFLKSLITNLNESVPAFQQVVVVASGFGHRRSKLLRTAKNIRAREVIIQFAPMGSAGANRNIGWALASSEIVCFLDADDTYAPFRNTVINSLEESGGFDLMLHAFEAFDTRLPNRPRYAISKDLNPQSVVRNEALIIRKPRNRESELRGETDSTNLVFRDWRAEFAVQHAHIIIRNELRKFVSFHEVFGVRNEDGVLAQDVLEQGFRVVLVPLILSGYRQGARAKPRKRAVKIGRLLKSASAKLPSLAPHRYYIVDGKIVGRARDV